MSPWTSHSAFHHVSPPSHASFHYCFIKRSHASVCVPCFLCDDFSRDTVFSVRFICAVPSPPDPDLSYIMLRLLSAFVIRARNIMGNKRGFTFTSFSMISFHRLVAVSLSVSSVTLGVSATLLPGQNRCDVISTSLTTLLARNSYRFTMTRHRIYCDDSFFCIAGRLCSIDDYIFIINQWLVLGWMLFYSV